MPLLPAPRDIPRGVFSTLLVKELKSVLMYHNRVCSGNHKSIYALKDALIDSLRDGLVTLYVQHNRSVYDKLIHYICVLLRRRLSAGSFLDYHDYQWYNNETHPIPTGPLSAEAQGVIQQFNSPSRRRESIGVPSAVPGGLVNPQFQNSPAAPPARANPRHGSYSMTTADIEKVMFCDYGLLMPKSSVIKPFSYPASPHRLQAKSVSLKLTTDIVDLLEGNSKDPTKERYGIHLYVANMASVCNERRLNANASAKLYMPQGLQLRVNGTHEPTLLHPSGMYARPIDVTSLIHNKPDYTNQIAITYMSKHPLIIAFMLTVQHSPQSLSDHIHKRSLATIEQVRKQFFKAQSDDDDIIDEGALINLKCPLGLSRIKAPCRAKQCQHLQCFDCVTFLQFYSKIAQWKCPVCSISIKSWHDLIADSYFEDILQNTSENDEQVYIDPSGDWKLKKDAENLGTSKGKTNKRSLEVEDVDAIDLSDLSDSRDHGSNRNKRQRTDFVDLTLDSDEDDCEDADDLPPMTQEEMDMIGELEADEASSQVVSYSTSDPRAITLALSGQLVVPGAACAASSPAINSAQADSTPTVAVSTPSLFTGSSVRSDSLSSTNASTPANMGRAQSSGTLNTNSNGNAAVSSPAASATAQNIPRYEHASTSLSSSLQPSAQFTAQPTLAHAVSSPITATVMQEQSTARRESSSSLAVCFTANGLAVSSAPGWRVATKSPTGNSNTSTNGPRRGCEVLNRRATSSAIMHEPTAIINTTVAGIDIASAGAHNIQRRMSNTAQNMLHSTSPTQQDMSAGSQNPLPSLVRDESDTHAANSRVVSSSALTSNSLPTSPMGMRSPINGQQTSARIISQPTNTSAVTPCPVHSQRSPLVGISPTYSSLFLRSQVNNAPSGGGATRPSNPRMAK